MLAQLAQTAVMYIDDGAVFRNRVDLGAGEVVVERAPPGHDRQQIAQDPLQAARRTRHQEVHVAAHIGKIPRDLEGYVRDAVLIAGVRDSSQQHQHPLRASVRLRGGLGEPRRHHRVAALQTLRQAQRYPLSLRQRRQGTPFQVLRIGPAIPQEEPKHQRGLHGVEEGAHDRSRSRTSWARTPLAVSSSRVGRRRGARTQGKTWW